MRVLGELEAQVMHRIWARAGAVTVRDIVDDLQNDRPIAYTTVMTVMDNLRKKGWLRRRAPGAMLETCGSAGWGCTFPVTE